MPLSFLLAALFGKAAAGAIVKGTAAKVTTVGAKGFVGHHGHHKLARHVAKAIAEEVAEGMRSALARRRRRDT